MAEGKEIDSRTGIAVFVKRPEPGKVKTRLAKDLGDEEATLLYQLMIESLRANVLRDIPRCDFAVYFYCDPFFEIPDEVCRPQVGADLGEKLTNAFRELLADHAQAMAIGTDCVDITLDHLWETRNSKAPVVLGPAEDGGYYLIATRELYPVLFEAIPWSTHEVYAQTLSRAAEISARVHELPRLRDIDTIEDLRSTTFGKRLGF